jgi:hypothetical protein
MSWLDSPLHWFARALAQPFGLRPMSRLASPFHSRPPSLILFSLDAEASLTADAICDLMATHPQRRLYGTRLHTTRRLLFSSALASALDDSRPRHTSNEVFVSSTATSTCQGSSVVTTHVLAARHTSSSTAACSRAFSDGSDRHHFFQRIAILLPREPSKPDDSGRRASVPSMRCVRAFGPLSVTRRL